MKLPWAEARSRFTLLFERLAIEWLRHASQKVVPEILHLPWDEIHCIMDRAVVRGLARREAEPVGLIGVAEKSHRKGHSYFTLVNDIGRSRVLHIGDDRNQTSLDGFWSTLTEEQRQAVEAVALDMWDPYISSIRTHLPAADDKMVFDKFHIARHPGEAVDKI